MEISELKNMVYLLDDSDDRVVSHVEEKIFSLGLTSIPLLESLWPDEESVVRQERIIELIKRIKQNVLADELKSWLNSDDQDLLDGIFIINKILDPNIDRQVIENQLGDVPVTYADIEKSKKLLDYNPKIDLKEGLKRTSKWIIDQCDNNSNLKIDQTI